MISAQRPGRVLVMDDEEFVLEMVADILEGIGLVVELASNGQDAVRLYKEAFEMGNPFQVVIMDLVIPAGMGGKEAIMELKKIDPNVKAIVSSGYSNDPIMSNFLKYGFSDVIAKPYKIKELQDAVKTILEMQ